MQPSKSKKGLKDGCTPALGGPGCWRRKEGSLVEEPRAQTWMLEMDMAGSCP